MGLDCYWVKWKDELVNRELVIDYEVPENEGGYFRGKIYDFFVDDFTDKYTLYWDLTNEEVLDIANQLSYALRVVESICSSDAVFVDYLRGYQLDLSDFRYLVEMFIKFSGDGYGIHASW